MFLPLRHTLPSGAGGRRAAALNFLAARSGLILCILFLLAGLALAGDYGIAPDEPNQRRTAQDNLDYILGRAGGVATAIYHDRVYGVALELPLLLAEQALGLKDAYEIHRLRATLTHLFFILGGFFCYRLAYQLCNSRPLALLALLLYLLHPRIYAQSYLNSKDPAFLSMFVLTLYLLERAFRRDTLGAFALFGVAAGLLLNLRIMGVMLPAAALAMRGLDWFQAGGGPERKQIRQTAGLLVLTAGLTAYALSPYAWTNPRDYLALSLNLTVNHPNTWLQLFQGELIRSYELPWRYGLTWFGITTPPPILLLGFIGMAALAARGLRRPGAAWGNTRLRFGLLLLACCLLPPLAAALLGSTQYEGWRHLYFVYGPFCLLAAWGGGGLAAALSRQRFWRPGGYGLAGLGLALLLLPMMQLHPLQYVYFNFLVDRTTPERLQARYEMDYWRLAPRAALEHLLQLHPGETLAVRGERQPRETLPPAARRRIIRAAAGGRADYEIIHRIDPSQPDLVFNSRYGRFYNNALTAARPLDDTRMTPAAVAAYREIYRDATAGEPIIRADYNVYRNGRRLTFIRENCPPEEGDAWLGVRLFPHRLETLPPEVYNPGSYASFGNHRVRLGAVCLAVLRLPDYARGDLILMQRSVGNFGPVGAPAWQELYSLSRPGLAELIAEYRRKEPPPPPDAFVVFLDRAAGRNRLLYAKADCTAAEYATPITLHIAPAHQEDLPSYSRGSSFENRDFPPDYYGGRPGGDCIAIVPLPDYPIQAIHTGQGNRWEVNLYPPADPDALPAAYRALAGREPAARGVFDLYWEDKRLVYVRESCTAADTAADFFLHIIPDNVAALPADRQATGFANRDFAFEGRGGHFDGKCLAAVPLPDYPVAALRTGQHIPGQGELWAAELAGGR